MSCASAGKKDPSQIADAMATTHNSISNVSAMMTYEDRVHGLNSCVTPSVLDAPWFLVASLSRLTMAVLGWVAPSNPWLLAAFYAASVAYAASIVMTVIQTLVWILDGTVGAFEAVLALWWMGWSQIIPFGLIGPAISLFAIGRKLATFEAHQGLVSDHRLVQLNAKAGLSLFSMWLTLIMGAYLIGSAMLIAAACG